MAYCVAKLVRMLLKKIHSATKTIGVKVSEYFVFVMCLWRKLCSQ